MALLSEREVDFEVAVVARLVFFVVVMVGEEDLTVTLLVW